MSDTDFSDVADWLTAEQGAPEPEGGTPEVVEPEVEEKAEAQPRDAKGRFASQEEAEKAWEHANAALGRQGQEYGELKKQVEILSQQLSQPQPQAQQMTQDTFEALVERSPRAAAEWARLNDPAGVDGDLHNSVMEEWHAVAPAAATAYQIDLSLGKLTEQVQAQQAPLVERAQQADMGSAWNELKREIPDLDEFAPQILQALDVGGEAHELVDVFASGKKEDMKRVFRNQYKSAKLDFLQANQTAPEGQEPDPAADAFVASGSQAREPERKSTNDAWLEKYFDPYATEIGAYGTTNPT